MTELTAAILQVVVIFLFFYAIVAVPLSFIFSRLGESKVAGWIPIYNLWLFYRLGQVSPILSLTFFAPVWGFIIGMYAKGIGLEDSAAAIVSIVITALLLTFLVSSCFVAYNISKELAQSGLWVILWIVNSVIWLYIIAFVKFAPQDPITIKHQAYGGSQQYPATPGPYSSSNPVINGGYNQPPAQPSYNPPPATLGGNDNGGWGLVNGGNNDDNPYLK